MRRAVYERNARRGLLSADSRKGRADVRSLAALTVETIPETIIDDLKKERVPYSPRMGRGEGETLARFFGIVTPSTMGHKGWQAITPAKRKASAMNGRKGGRPPVR